MGGGGYQMRLRIEIARGMLKLITKQCPLSPPAASSRCEHVMLTPLQQDKTAWNHQLGVFCSTILQRHHVRRCVCDHLGKREFFSFIV